MQLQINTWGNSQGIRIPKDMLDEAGFSVGEKIDARVENGAVVLTKVFRHKTLEERAAEYGGKLNLDGEGDWFTPMGNEVW